MQIGEGVCSAASANDDSEERVKVRLRVWDRHLERAPRGCADADGELGCDAGCSHGDASSSGVAAGRAPTRTPAGWESDRAEDRLPGAQAPPAGGAAWRARGGQRYEVRVAGVIESGTTGPNGQVELQVPAHIGTLWLFVGERPDRVAYRIRVCDGLESPDSVPGVQQRLNNLGFRCGAVDGDSGPRTRAALRGFQRAHGLDGTGELDAQTSGQLRNEHGS